MISEERDSGLENFLSLWKKLYFQAFLRYKEYNGFSKLIPEVRNMKRKMKKWLALIAALVMALGCCAAGAEGTADGGKTLQVKMTLDAEAVKGLAAAAGIPADKLEIVDPLIALVNALGVKETVTRDGGEIVLDLNGTDILSIGCDLSGDNIALGCSLIPNYVITVKMGTILQLAKDAVTKVGGGLLGGLDLAGGIFAGSGDTAVIEETAGNAETAGSNDAAGKEKTGIGEKLKNLLSRLKLNGIRESSLNLRVVKDGPSLRFEFRRKDTLVVVEISREEDRTGRVAIETYTGNSEQPAFSWAISTSRSEGRSLAVRGEGKTEVALEDILSGSGEALQGLLADFMSNGLGKVLPTLYREVPEISGMLTGLLMPGTKTSTDDETAKSTEPAGDVPQETDATAWKTLGDVLPLATGNREATWNENEYTILFWYGGTEWLVIAKFSAEQDRALGQVDFFAEDRDDQINAILAPSEILSAVDVKTLALPQEALDRWIGRKGQELVDAGWEPNGYEYNDDGSIDVNMVKDKCQYRVAFAEKVMPPENYDDVADFTGATIAGMMFNGHSYHIFDAE